MSKIVIKPCNGTDGSPSRALVLKTLYDNGVQVTSIRSNNGVHNVYCSEDGDTDKLFSEVCITALFSAGCEPVLPPQIRAKRTVILRNIDHLICEHEANDIKNEIEHSNENLVVDDIYKFRNGRMLKVTLKTHQMAMKCTESGLYMFSLRVPPRSIDPDRYIEVLTCYRCFKLDDHTSNFCDKDINYKVCSLCSGSNHTSRECSATVKKCLNCSGPHSTFAMACPNRKNIIQTKRKEQSTYAGKVTGNHRVAASNTPSIPIQHISDHLSSPAVSEVISKSALCVVIAAMKSKESNTDFEQVMNELLVANGLPTFNMGNVSPPHVIPEPTPHNVDVISSQKNDNGELPAATASTVSRRSNFGGTATHHNVDVVSSQRNDSGKLSAATATTISRRSNFGGTATALSNVTNNIITVYKKRGSTKPCVDNIVKLVAEKKIVLESNLSAADCLKLMSNSINVADIVEVPVSKFNEKLNAVSHVSGVVPIAGVLDRNN